MARTGYGIPVSDGSEQVVLENSSAAAGVAVVTVVVPPRFSRLKSGLDRVPTRTSCTIPRTFRAHPAHLFGGAKRCAKRGAKSRAHPAHSPHALGQNQGGDEDPGDGARAPRLVERFDTEPFSDFSAK